MVHRDVKPENILFDEGGHVFLSDFGVVKAIDEDLNVTEAGTGVGSPKERRPWTRKPSAVSSTDATRTPNQYQSRSGRAGRLIRAQDVVGRRTRLLAAYWSTSQSPRLARLLPHPD